MAARSAWIGLILPVTLTAVWEAASRLGVVPAHLLPAPTTIVATIAGMVLDGTLWTHVGSTLCRVLAGFLIGTVAATVLGVWAGMSRLAARLYDPIIQAFRAIPSIAWVPLFILWMGIGEASKVALIAVGVFFPVYLNVVSGIRGVDRKLTQVGEVYRLGPLEQARRIILPAALPSFLVGLRGGLGLGWMFVVAAELMGADRGLGYLLVFGENTYSPALVIASIVMFALLGKATDAVLAWLERRLLSWQDSLANSV